MPHPIFPTVCHEPRILYKGNADGSRASTNTTTIADTERTELAGFSGANIALVIRNKSGGGVAIGAGKTIQVETTGQDKGSVTDFSSPPDFLFDVSNIDDNDTAVFSITGPPGQRWRVLNSATANIQVEWYEAPNR